MNKTLFYLFLFSFLSVSSCCENVNVDAFKIVNNTDDDILFFYDKVSHYKFKVIGGPLEEGGTTWEYKHLLKNACISAHSYKYFDYMKPMFYRAFESDTLYIAIFNMLDYDTLSRDEFKSKYPIKYEYKVTLQDMIDCDWTLIYPPND